MHKLLKIAKETDGRIAYRVALDTKLSYVSAVQRVRLRSVPVNTVTSSTCCLLSEISSSYSTNACDTMSYATSSLPHLSAVRAHMRCMRSASSWSTEASALVVSMMNLRRSLSSDTWCPVSPAWQKLQHGKTY